jgi:spermidine synthase
LTEPGPPASPSTPSGDWFFEVDSSGYAQGLRVRDRIVATRTPFQQLEIFETDAFGRVLVLDSALQTSEFDEFMYHEMLVHPPMMTHPNPRRVLIIGGGDGGTLRRVLEYPNAEPVQVEIDAAVISSCKAHMPQISRGAFDDPRATVIIGDGIAYMKENPGAFDVVIVDSTDPVGPAVQLFEVPFYEDVYRSLAPDGLLVAQSSSPLMMGDDLRRQVANMRQVFQIVRTYLGNVTGYPGGLWSYTIASRQHDPLHATTDAIASRLAENSSRARYYTPALHHAAFTLPAFISDLLG